MRAAGLVVVCIVASTAHAQHFVPAPPPPQRVVAPAPGLELAGTWSGNTNEPAVGWRAAFLYPITGRPMTGSTPYLASTSLIVRYDNHGAPAEGSDAETRAKSLGLGVRSSLVLVGPSFRAGVFAEGTLGATRSRHADQVVSDREGHWMLSGGILVGTHSFLLVVDFGWLVTDAGDGRIGPIASLGLHVVLD